MKNLASYRPRQVRQVKLRGEIIADLNACKYLHDQYAKPIAQPQQ